jgi:proline iminopeptidase
MIKLRSIISLIVTAINVCCNTSVSFSQNNTSANFQYWELPTGSKIAYYYFKGKEPRKSTPIIYLHGGPGGYVTLYDIKAFSKLADDGYDVYLYDQVGGGKSERLANIMEYTPDRHLRDLEAIVDKIGANKIILIGHSWGASLAPLYIAKHPDKVVKLILSGPGGIIPKTFNYNLPTPDSIKLKRNSNIKSKRCSRQELKGLQRLYKIDSKADKGLKIASDEEIDSLFDNMMIFRSKNNKNDSLKQIDYERGAGGYSNEITGKYLFTGTEIRDTLSKCNVPVLILLGEYDGLQWACVNDYLKVFKHTKLIVIPKSGHPVFSYQPDFCLKLAREFLSSNEK